jgi:protocatechuate 3,4-dioxygenase beta subunit
MKQARAAVFTLAIAATPWLVHGQAPARDRTAPQTGTAVIRGRITAADTGRPLRRAQVLIYTVDGFNPDAHVVNTGIDGSYELRDLPAGRYRIEARRAGYLTLQYGQRRPLEQGKPLEVRDKQQIDQVDFALPRMSAITGRITDEAGDPIAGATLFAMRSVYIEGRRRLVPAAQTRTNGQTDDLGQYRILGLAPGSYYVMAMMRDTWTVNEGGVVRTLGYATTYFPGATSASEAGRVTLAIGQEGAADFSLVPGRAAKISGSVFDSRGAPAVGHSVELSQELRNATSTATFNAGAGVVAADGTFTIKNVAPGEYKIKASASYPGKTPGTLVPEEVAMMIAVNGVDIDNVSIVTPSGWRASGRITDETGGVAGVPRGRMSISGRAVNTDNDPRTGTLVANTNRLSDDGTFVVGGLFGPQRIRVVLPDGWMVKAIRHDGRDVADTASDLKSGEELSGLQVVITNKVTTVSGQLTDDKGAPVSDGTIIVFAADAEKWSEDSRYVRSARPDQQGQYQIKGLPPGEYLAVAVDYVQDGMWNDPEYLESIRRHGQKLTLVDASTQTIQLRIVQ